MDGSLMDKIVALCKRRGFIFPGSEIYGGLANSWDYGPLGVLLKNNIKELWWRKFVMLRDDTVGLDASIIMNPKVWEASGHIANFVDPLIECEICHERVRADHEGVKKEHEKKHEKEGSKTTWTEPKMFNLMFKTNIGPAEGTSHAVYLRPETAQSIFVDFRNIVDTTRIKIPFGVAQIGKAFRNEITPGNFIFRVREFEQMEIEYFIPPPKTDEDWQKVFENWRELVTEWITKDLGLDSEKVFEFDVPEKERAHYSKRTIDFQYDFPFGREELYGLAYRTDFDLKNHQKMSGQNLLYKNQETGEEYIPHVIEPSFGMDRSIIAVLVNSYTEEGNRIYLKLPLKLAPVKVAVFPLLANKEELVNLAKKVHSNLKKEINGMVAFDDRGNIGKRYFSQDEIGTPFCITVDFQTLEDNTVTVRDRDTTKQERINIEKLSSFINTKLS